MHLLKAAAVAGMCLSLAACSPADLVNAFNTVITNPLHNKEVALIGVGLGTLNGVFSGYQALPLCPAGHSFQPDDWCHDAAVNAAVNKVQNTAVDAYGDLVSFQEANPAGSVVVDAGFSAKWHAAEAAYTTLRNLMIGFGIKGATNAQAI